MVFSSKQKMVIQSSVGSEDYSPLKSIPSLKTEHDLMIFRAIITQLVLAILLLGGVIGQRLRLPQEGSWLSSSVLSHSSLISPSL